MTFGITKGIVESRLKTSNEIMMSLGDYPATIYRGQVLYFSIQIDI